MGSFAEAVSPCLGVKAAGIASVTTLYAKSSVSTESLSWAWPTGRRLSTSTALSLPRICVNSYWNCCRYRSHLSILADGGSD